MISYELMPWYVLLLGGSPTGREFDRLLDEFSLTSDENDKSESSRWYENDQLGVSVFIWQGKVDAIQFFSAENPYFEGCLSQLPLGLSFAMTRDEVRKYLGEPDDVTPELREGTLRHAGIDRYRTLRGMVAVSYSATSGRLEVLAFESPESNSGATLE